MLVLLYAEARGWPPEVTIKALANILERRIGLDQLKAELDIFSEIRRAEIDPLLPNPLKVHDHATAH